MYTSKKVHCVSHNKGVFEAWKFLKLFVNMIGDSEFVALLRPIPNNTGGAVVKGLVVFNDDFEVDAMSSDIYDILNIDMAGYAACM